MAKINALLNVHILCDILQLVMPYRIRCLKTTDWWILIKRIEIRSEKSTILMFREIECELFFRCHSSASIHTEGFLFNIQIIVSSSAFTNGNASSMNANERCSQSVVLFNCIITFLLVANWPCHKFLHNAWVNLCIYKCWNYLGFGCQVETNKFMCTKWCCGILYWIVCN